VFISFSCTGLRSSRSITPVWIKLQDKRESAVEIGWLAFFNGRHGQWPGQTRPGVPGDTKTGTREVSATARGF